MVVTLGVVDCVDRRGGGGNAGRWDPLAGKCIAGQSLARWTIRRMSDAMQLDRIVTIVPDEPSSLESHVPNDVTVVRSSAPDALGRLANVVEEIPCDGIVRAFLDQPLLDPVLIDALVVTASKNEHCYVSFATGDGRPVIGTSVGVFAEWFSADAVRKANKSCQDDAHRQHGTSYIYSNPKLFNVRLIPAPCDADRDDVRLTLSDGLDIETVEDILEALGPDRLDWQEVFDLLEDQPSLRERMAAQNRASMNA